jgi:undecaprenyl-diphosphatase
MLALDNTIHTLLITLEYAPLTAVSKVVAIIFDPITMTLISLVIAGCAYYFKRKNQAFWFASTMIVTGIVIKLLKILVHRQRPSLQLVQETGYSFPSGHAVISTVFLGLLFIIWCEEKSAREKLIGAICTALIVLFVSFTRIYLRVHWLSDIVGGMLVGVLILFIAKTTNPQKN